MKGSRIMNPDHFNVIKNFDLWRANFHRTEKKSKWAKTQTREEAEERLKSSTESFFLSWKKCVVAFRSNCSSLIKVSRPLFQHGKEHFPFLVRLRLISARKNKRASLRNEVIRGYPLAVVQVTSRIMESCVAATNKLRPTLLSSLQEIC